MAAKGKGRAYYQNNYTHEQLWDMLHAGDDYKVERAGSIWTSASSGMKAAREELDVHVTGLRTQWKGAASDEFDGRMNIIKQYSVEAENGMKSVGEITIPGLANALKTAQTNSESLNPAYIDEYEDWVESKKQVDASSPEAQTNKTQWQQEYRNELDKSHGELAQIVADLGDVYATARETRFEIPPEPPPSEMPGNSTYQPPTGGVFATDTLQAPGMSDGVLQPAGSDVNGDGVIDENDTITMNDDLDPVEGGWNYDSYDNVDGGGLASGGLLPTGGGPGGGLGPTGGGGPGATTGLGAGLFPTQTGGGGGSSTARGAGSTPSRTAGSSPARAGASNAKPGTSGSNSGGRPGSTGNRGGLSQASRNAIKGGGPGGNGPRPPGSGNSRGGGGTRGGAYNDEEEETYTHETWLVDDEVDWGRNNVRREELDDED
ncbi:hypothetical protein AB0B28_05525 [Glycomyces sp. NPDC046736]|uniref:hypothetical protein n=1 Tax=Glycomyces sp. NPDC046736 TaxID=3155615 RepID=UPI0034056867